jgi:hypothetical protein
MSVMNVKLQKELVRRGLILEILKADSATAIDAEDIRCRLDLFGHAVLPDDMMPLIRYLASAGYVELTEKHRGEIILVRITKHGDDLVNGLHEDEGVLIPRK